MKKHTKYHDPVNYRLTAKDLENTEDYHSFLTALTDIPASDPTHTMSITEAGIVNQQVFVHIADFENPKQFVPVLCDVSVSVDLQQQRGIHMSRCVQAIFDLSTKKFTNLDEFAAELAQAVREKQESQIGRAEITGTYIHKTTTKKTQQLSLNKLYLLGNATATSQETKVQTGMKVYNITACPCTKTYTKYSTVPELQKMGHTLEEINRILEISLSGTHTQRGTTTLLLDKDAAPISYKDLYTVLEQSVHFVYDLLKRPDEHELVMRALQNPQFTEDVARQTTFNAYQRFKNTLSPHAKLHVESVLLDSIHIHNVRAMIHKTIGEIKKEVE